MLNAGTSGPYEGRTPKGMCLQSMCRQPANIIFVSDEIKKRVGQRKLFEDMLGDNLTLNGPSISGGRTLPSERI